HLRCDLHRLKERKMSIVLEKFPNSENAYGIRDARFANRWLDLWGDVQKYVVDGPVAKDDTTGIPAEWTVTQTGTSPMTVSAVPGNALLLTTGGTDFNGINAQLAGTQFELASGKPCYFGVKAALSEATQSDFLVGLAGIDTTLTAASATHALAVSASGVFFSKIDAVTQTTFKTFTTATEGNSANVSTMDTASHVYEIVWDGTTLFGYIDGVLVATFTGSLPTAAMTPSLVVRAGDGNARTLTVSWIRAFQVRG
ncbi:MAG: hypothetical protein ACRCWC_09960, partial [Plesiomonas shigelloides]